MVDEGLAISAAAERITQINYEQLFTNALREHKSSKLKLSIAEEKLPERQDLLNHEDEMSRSWNTLSIKEQEDYMFIRHDMFQGYIDAVVDLPEFKNYQRSRDKLFFALKRVSEDRRS